MLNDFRGVYMSVRRWLSKEIDLKNVLSGVFLFVLLLFIMFVFTLIVSLVLHIGNKESTSDFFKIGKEYIMPIIVMSASFIALLNLKETTDNNKHNRMWQKREKTMALLEGFERATDSLMKFTRMDDMEHLWSYDDEDCNSLQGAVDYVSAIARRDKRDNSQHFSNLNNELRVMINIYESMAIRFNNDLVDKELFRAIYYDAFKMNAFDILVASKGYLNFEPIEFVKLLNDWKIDYTFSPRYLQRIENTSS